MKSRDYLSDPRALLAQQLMQSGSSTAPVQSPTEGIARALTGMVGAYQQNLLKGEYDQKSKDAAKELQRIRMDNPQGGDPLLQAMLSSNSDYVRTMGEDAYGKTVADMLKPKEPIKMGSGDVLYDPVTKKPIYTAPITNEPLEKVMDPTTGAVTYVPRSQAVGKNAYTSQTSLNVYPATGAVSFTQGAPNPLQKPTMNKLEEKLLNSTEMLSRLGDIESQFKPEYLQLGTRLNMKGSEMKDFVGVPLDEMSQQQLSDYTGFRRSSVENLNRILNELSGAAVSPHEYERLKASQPSAGTGIFDGDSPTQFKRKMEDVTKQQRNAVMRYNYAIKNGMNPLKTGIDLDKIPQLIEKRGAQIEQEIRRQMPNATDQQIDMETRARLATEFGMQ